MILQTEKVSKAYGKTQALKEVSFEIPKGQIAGLLGPNGSGKTTIIKIINDLISDYTGKVSVCGNPVGIESKKLVSFLPDSGYLPKDLKITTAFNMFRDFYADFDMNKAEEMLSVMKLDKNARINSLSKGMHEKLQLLLVMSRKASLYIFDEPIAGVDPAARDVILETIIKNYSEDASVLFSTHLISDVENILDRVLFLKSGELVLDGMADELRETNGKSIDQLFREAFKC